VLSEKVNDAVPEDSGRRAELGDPALEVKLTLKGADTVVKVLSSKVAFTVALEPAVTVWDAGLSETVASQGLNVTFALADEPFPPVFVFAVGPVALPHQLSVASVVTEFVPLVVPDSLSTPTGAFTKLLAVRVVASVPLVVPISVTSATQFSNRLPVALTVRLPASLLPARSPTCSPTGELSTTGELRPNAPGPLTVLFSTTALTDGATEPKGWEATSIPIESLVALALFDV
jgi:hypothetical protein